MLTVKLITTISTTTTTTTTNNNNCNTPEQKDRDKKASNCYNNQLNLCLYKGQLRPLKGQYFHTINYLQKWHQGQPPATTCDKATGTEALTGNETPGRHAN